MRKKLNYLLIKKNSFTKEKNVRQISRNYYLDDSRGVVDSKGKKKKKRYIKPINPTSTYSTSYGFF